MAIGVAKASANPIQIVAQCRESNPRKSYPSFITERQDTAAPTQRTVMVKAAHLIQVEWLHLA